MYKVINRNAIKVSYSCKGNIQQMIKKKYNSIIQKKTKKKHGILSVH